MTEADERGREPSGAAFAGRTAFHDALCRLFAEAARQGARELLCSDTDFADWPLDDGRLLASLSAWARPQRRLLLLAARYDEVARRHPRWLAWRRTWTHCVSCRQVDDDFAAAGVPTLLIVPGSGTVRLLDRIRQRGVVSRAAGDVAHARNEFDAISQRSGETFGATTLGL